jgi:hypothetical protein
LFEFLFFEEEIEAREEIFFIVGVRAQVIFFVSLFRLLIVLFD